jgi:Signal peptidase, peptidase S26
MTATTGAALGATIIATAVAALLAVRHRCTVITVRGPSMAPTLQSGETILARRVRGQTVRSGDIVILRVPGLGTDGTPNRYTAIKRVAATVSDPAGTRRNAWVRRRRPARRHRPRRAARPLTPRLRQRRQAPLKQADP